MFAITFRMSALCGVLVLIVPVAADDKKPAPAELKVGDQAPSFHLLDEAGVKWNSADRFGMRWVVVYFYPGDFTPHCTDQAAAFRDAVKELTQMGVEVVGVSGDTVEIHGLFKKSQNLNFTILSDEDGAVAAKFGVPFGKESMVRATGPEGKPLLFTRPGTAARWTFVVGKDGKIAYKNTKVEPKTDAKTVTEFIAAQEKK